MHDPTCHPTGESESTALVPHAGPVAVDTFGGRIHVEWDPQAAVTPLGQLPFFTEFLQVSGLFDPWVEGGPLFLTSPNAPSKRVRRNLGKLDETAGVTWLQDHLGYGVAPLLGEPWILDSDVTVKSLYGHQEGAVKGYNPHKPGRPSHTYHPYFIANLRRVLDVEVQAGNQTASKYSSPGLWELLARLPRAHWPVAIHGDRDWGDPGEHGAR